MWTIACSGTACGDRVLVVSRRVRRRSLSGIESFHSPSFVLSGVPYASLLRHSRAHQRSFYSMNVRYQCSRDVVRSMSICPSLCDPCEHVMSITVTRKHSQHAMGIPYFNVRCSIRHCTKKCRPREYTRDYTAEAGAHTRRV